MAEHKIAVGKSDEATVIAEKIIEAEGDEIVLAIPRFSKLAEAGANFRLLHREAEALGKNLTVETVDEAVAELAKANGIECRNPFFNNSMKRFSDIVTGKPEKPYAKSREAREEAPRVRAEHGAVGHPRNHFSHEDPIEVRKVKRGRYSFLPPRPLVYLGIGLAVLTGAGIVSLAVLPRADIRIVVKKIEWSFVSPVAVDSALAALDATLRKIPGQLFSDEKNIELSFPASGKGNVLRKATGVVTIWNTASAAPQPLVATTRLFAPDGKIFRLVNRVVVPGATILDGKLTPASVEAEVAADKAGEAWNIGPVAKFTIPGFAGTPKANMFYAESKTAMAGGFIGETAYPTPDDLTKAKASAAEALKDSMRLVLLAGLDPSFEVIDGATSFKVTAQRVREATDADGKFSVFTEGKMSVMVFRESDVLAFLSETLASQGASADDFEVRSYDLKYGVPTFGPKGDLSVPLDYRSTLARRVDIDSFREKIRGKSEADLRSIIFSPPEVESAKVALWPFWVRRIPDNTSRITVVVD